MGQIDSRPAPSVRFSQFQTSSEPPPSVLFERLLPRYCKHFGSAPPVTSASVEEMIRLMRRSLAEGSPRVEG
jgi:hypothetical protein